MFSPPVYSYHAVVSLCVTDNEVRVKRSHSCAVMTFLCDGVITFLSS